MTAGNHVGYVIKTLPGGYGGPLEVIVGITLDGTINGVRVGNHQETPGLGAKAKTVEFYGQYDGLSVGSPVEVIKVDVTSGNNEIKAISGATITSVAVTNGVNYGQMVIDTFK
jgi:electron transport complex protein RnfG